MTSPVLDLSHHNPTPDWYRILEAGVVGIIHKATEGTSYVDDTLFSRARDALDAGLCWSTYHFLRPGNLKEQMDHYLGTIDPRPGERVCLDHEDPGVSLGNLEDCVEYILAQRPDLQICIYSGHVIKEQLGNGYSDVLAKNTSLWIAHYTTASNPSWPKGTWPAWSLWQYTDHESVPGISAPVDGDRWNGTPEALVEWFGPAGEVPVPVPPEPEAKAVNIQITATEGVAIYLTINGEVISL